MKVINNGRNEGQNRLIYTCVHFQQPPLLLLPFQFFSLRLLLGCPRSPLLLLRLLLLQVLPKSLL